MSYPVTKHFSYRRQKHGSILLGSILVASKLKLHKIMIPDTTTLFIEKRVLSAPFAKWFHVSGLIISAVIAAEFTGFSTGLSYGFGSFIIAHLVTCLLVTLSSFLTLSRLTPSLKQSWKLARLMNGRLYFGSSFLSYSRFCKYEATKGLSRYDWIRCYIRWSLDHRVFRSCW